MLLLLLACTGGPDPLPEPPPELLSEPEPSPVEAAPVLTAVGDVGPDRAVLWVRASGYNRVWATVDAGAATWRSEDAPVRTAADFTATLPITGLPPGQTLRYALRGSTTAPPDEGELLAEGTFTTAPASDAAAPVKLAVMGDLGGQGYCRPAEGGYGILGAIADRAPDVVIANGDLIYADGDCPARAPDGIANLPGDFPAIAEPWVDWTDARRVREVFDAHWRYNRSDPNFIRLTEVAPLIAQWDDHEVINDFGAPWDAWHTRDPERAGYTTLVEVGRAAFFDWNPITPHPDEPHRVYRSFRWGRHLEVFIVDGRSYRSPNPQPDGPEKTLLGAAQRDWLTQAVAASDATWKVISVDVPISIPSGSQAWKAGRDGWANGVGDPTTPEGEEDRSVATGYEAELTGILDAWQAKGVDGVVFVTTDVHFSQTLRYTRTGGFTFHEVVSGPLRAWMGEPGPLDPTFGPTSLYAESGVPTFAWLELSADGQSLSVATCGPDGQPRPGSALTLKAE
ncbi:MAG: alkaline phosphatase D family protein [Alphaproteobacteria bacterium]|nr:alkaline phosphatase D family protein [Alphaproteobacteria bacterium]